MKIKDRRTLHFSVERIWQILEQPEYMVLWNPKCKRCDFTGVASLGSRFQVVSQLSKGPVESEAEVVTFIPHQQITFRYTFESMGQKGFVDDSFFLKMVGPQKTKVKHVTDFKHAKMPRIFKAVAWLICTFGYKVGPSMLENLEELLD